MTKTSEPAAKSGVEAIIALIAERGKTHGNFSDHARITQRFKMVFLDELQLREERKQKPLTAMQIEAIDMILHKFGRIVAGEPDFKDHWDDIAGYARIAMPQV